MHLEAYCLVHDKCPMICIHFASALHSIQQAPSWKGLHALVVKPPNVGKGYTFVLSESCQEVYMVFVSKIKEVLKRIIKNKNI